jgi:MFS family permease
MQVLALNWYVLQLTGSAASMGLTVLFATAPALVLGPLGGALADRLPGRPVLVATQALHAVLGLALAGIAFGAAPRVTLVYAIATLGGLVAALEGPVMGRFNSTIVEPRLLGNALSLGSVVSSTGRILGMALGGVLVAAAGTGFLFLANAASFVPVIVALFLIRPARPTLSPASPVPGSTRAGLAYLARQPIVLITLGLAVVLGSLGRNYQVTMAAMSAGPLHGGAGGYAALSTAFAVGTVLGGLMAAARAELGLRTLVGLGLVTSVMQAVVGLAPSVVTMAMVMVPIAAGAVMIDTTVSTRIQLDTHESMRGRVLGVAAAASGIAGAVGAPLLGWLSVHAGPRAALILGGVAATAACGAAGLAMARQRGLRLDRVELGLTLRHALGARPVLAPVRVFAMEPVGK